MKGRPTGHRTVTTAGRGGTTKVGGGGGNKRDLGFTHRPSAAAASPRPPASVKQGPVARHATAVSTSEHPFPLLAFLITEGTEDSLHESYGTSYVELDSSGGKTLLYQDIGNPNVRGPVVRKLMKEGVLKFDPGDSRRYEEAVRAAGGERAYRRQEISRIRKLLGWQEEETPFLGIINSARPAEYALLKIPETVVHDPGETRRLWKTIQSALAEVHLKGIHAGSRWNAKAMNSLQERLDVVTDQLIREEDVPSGASLICGKSDCTITFEGISRQLKPLKGMGALRRLVERPGESIPASELWYDGPRPPEISEWERYELDLTDGLPAGDKAVDKKTIARLKAERDRLLEASDRASDLGKLDEAQVLDEEAKDIEEQLGRVTSFGGRGRLVGDHKQRQVNTVCRRIQRAIAAIAAVHPTAGKHLSSFVRTGQECRYDPDPPVTWTT